MSVNIYDGTNLIPIAGKTVPAPTPDYVDAQYNASTTYSKGMTCISGNVRYRYKNSTASSGHQPPDATYWEVFSVADQLSNYESAWVELGRSIGTGSQTFGISDWKNLLSAQYRYIALCLILPSPNTGIGFNNDNGILGAGTEIYPSSFLVARTSYSVGEYISRTNMEINGILQFYAYSSTAINSMTCYDHSTGDMLTSKHGLIVYGIK